jgi:aspartate/glutamate racemase
MLKRDIADLPVDVQKEITSHRTKYWMAHSLFRESLKRFRITSSSTVSSLSPDDQEIGEVLINLYDDIENGQVTQKQFIDRMKKVQDINTAKARDDADLITNMLFGKTK